MNEFKTYHPIVNFTYFLFVIGFSCFFMHPFCLGISLVSGLIYSVMLKGRKQARKNLIYMLFVVLTMTLINPLFNHQGVTVLGYFPSGNPFTLESVVYGLSAGIMLLCIILHFSCYNEVMTSDKFIYLFGKIIPSLSLVLSMTLRFVPRFISQLKVVINSQKCMGRDIAQGGIIKRAKSALTILSGIVTWALENAVDTADSMKARGYGIPGRTAFSIYTFDKRDKMAFFCIVSLGVYTLVGYILGAMHFSYFPYIGMAEVSIYNISVILAYLFLCICPIIIEIKEVRKWKASR